MIRGATPTHIFKLPFEVDYIKCARIIYSQNDKIVLEKETTDCNMQGNTISVCLTQEETFNFDCHYLTQVQLRVITIEGNSLVSNIFWLDTNKCLHEEILE